MGDMVALEAKYHSALYYRAKTTVEDEPKTDHEGVMSRIVLAELVLYIEETHLAGQPFRGGQSGLACARHKGDRRPCSHRNSP